jgi:hypothetical protein
MRQTVVTELGFHGLRRAHLIAVLTCTERQRAAAGRATET